MNVVKREQLGGFRAPAREEREKIQPYMDRLFARDLKMMSFGNTVLSVFAGAMLLGLTAGWGDASPGELAVGAVLFAALAAGVFSIRLCRKQKRHFLNSLKEGRYQVMDCLVWEVLFSPELVSEAEVKICNDLGQHCDFRFLIDLSTARQCRDDKNTKLLLLKCGSDFYELLSDNKMGKG